MSLGKNIHLLFLKEIFCVYLFILLSKNIFNSLWHYSMIRDQYLEYISIAMPSLMSTLLHSVPQTLHPHIPFIPTHQSVSTRGTFM